MMYGQLSGCESLREFVCITTAHSPKSYHLGFGKSVITRSNLAKANFGVLGLGIMGRMIALNMERNGFIVAGVDLDRSKIDAFGSDSKGKNLIPSNSLKEFIETLEVPLRKLMMITAGICF